mgnify:CR=1 FL=1
MNLRYFEIKYFRWALVLLALGFIAISWVNCCKPFHEGVFFVEQNSNKSIAIGFQDCDPDEAKSGDIEGGEDSYNPLFYFSFPEKITLKNPQYTPLLIPRLNINIRNSRAPPVPIHS